MLVPVLEYAVVPDCVWSEGPMQAPVHSSASTTDLCSMKVNPSSVSFLSDRTLSAPLHMPAVFSP